MEQSTVDRIASVLERLQAQRAVRWAIAFAAIAWLVLQAVVLLADVYQLGPDAKRAAVALLAASFPTVLFVAWAIDSKSRARGAVVIAGVLISLLVGALVHQRLDRRAAPVQATLLVLPPTDLRAEGSRVDALAARVQESMLDTLARDRILKTLSRTVADSFDPSKATPSEFALAQGATHFVELSIKDASAATADPRLEITAQLITADDGTHVASYTKVYRAVSTVGIERDIATLLAGAFRIMLGPETWASLGEIRSSSEAARTLFKQAEVNIRYELGEDHDQLYAEALEIDPEFAQAAARRYLMQQGSDGASVRMDERHDLEERFNDDLDFEFFSFGQFGVNANSSVEWEERFANDPLFLFREASNSYIVEGFWGDAKFDPRTGRLDIPKTRAAYERAIAADPSFYWPRHTFAHQLYFSGDFDSADEQLAALEQGWPFTGENWTLERIQIRLAAHGDIEELRSRIAAYAASARPAPTPGRAFNVQVLETEHALAHLDGNLKAAIALGEQLGDAPLNGLIKEAAPLLQRRWTGLDEAAVAAFIAGDRAKARAHATGRLRALDAQLRKDGLDPDANKGLPLRFVHDRTFWRFIADPKSMTAAELQQLDDRLHYNKKWMESPMRLAFLYAWSGDLKRATTVLEECAKRRTWCSPWLMARDPWWAPLYGQPEFEQLLLANRATLVRHPGIKRTR